MRILFTLFVLIFTASFNRLSAADVKVEVLVKSDKMWDGTSLPDFSEKETEVTVLRITIPPHTTLPLHKHPMINAGYMVSGELTVESEDGKVLNLKQGDVLIELVDKWHFGSNNTDQPVVIVVFYVGTKGQPLSIKKQPIHATENTQIKH